MLQAVREKRCWLGWRETGCVCSDWGGEGKGVKGGEVEGGSKSDEVQIMIYQRQNGVNVSKSRSSRGDRRKE